MKTIKAARIHNYGGPEVVRVESTSIPEPQTGQVLIRVQCGRRESDRLEDSRGLFAADDAGASAVHLGRRLFGGGGIGRSRRFWIQGG